MPRMFATDLEQDLENEEDSAINWVITHDIPPSLETKEIFFGPCCKTMTSRAKKRSRMSRKMRSRRCAKLRRRYRGCDQVSVKGTDNGDGSYKMELNLNEKCVQQLFEHTKPTEVTVYVPIVDAFIAFECVDNTHHVHEFVNDKNIQIRIQDKEYHEKNMQLRTYRRKLVLDETLAKVQLNEEDYNTIFNSESPPKGTVTLYVPYRQIFVVVQKNDYRLVHKFLEGHEYNEEVKKMNEKEFEQYVEKNFIELITNHARP